MSQENRKRLLSQDDLIRCAKGDLSFVAAKSFLKRYWNEVIEAIERQEAETIKPFSGFTIKVETVSEKHFDLNKYEVVDLKDVQRIKAFLSKDFKNKFRKKKQELLEEYEGD